MRPAALFCLLPLLAACNRSPEPLFAVGTLERDRLELRAETDDPIVEIAVREGDQLAAGALVLRLDDARLAPQRDQARARLDEAKGRLAELVRGPRRENIAEARARLEGDQSALAVAERELERQQDLFGSGVVPAANVDQQRRERDTALARRDQDRAALDALVHGTTGEELDQARGAVAAAEAALADVEVRVGRLVVTAPIAGQLDALPFEVGERPRPGDTVAVLLAAGLPYARVYVPEPLLIAAGQGSVAEVRVDGDARVFRGRVRRLSSEAAFTPHFALTERDRSRLAYLAEVELEDTAATSLPTGVPVEVTFPRTEGAAP